MNKHNNCGNNIEKCLEVYLYDIVDVLYSGYCYKLNNDELLPAIMKKMEHLRKVQNNEAYYKIKKVKNIVSSALKDNRDIFEDNNCCTKMNLEQIYSICLQILKNNTSIL